MEYGQLVVGPPGSGKTTYVEGVRQLLVAIKRPHLRINLDFANEFPQFDPYDVDVRQFITVSQVMDQKSLGPNGALIYCAKHLADHGIKWLKDQIKAAKQTPHVYYIIDMPGQTELYTHDDSIVKVVQALGYRVAAVHLVDATLCLMPHHYISALLLSLTAQISLEMPFVNLFSKVDLLEKEKMPFTLEYFSRAEDLEYLIANTHASSKLVEKERKLAELHTAITEIVSDFNLVGFLPLNVENKQNMIDVLAAVDQANGYSLSAYLPPHLRVPGLEEADQELRLPANPLARVYGSEWFEAFQNINDPIEEISNDSIEEKSNDSIEDQSKPIQ